MTLNQAKTIVAQYLLKLGMPQKQVSACIELTRDDAIINAANVATYSDNLTLAVFRDLIYVPNVDD